MKSWPIKMRYRVRNSKSGEYVIYRKFRYKRNLNPGVKGFLSVFFMSLGIYLVLPTPEDVIIYGAVGKYISYTFKTPISSGVLYASLIFEGAGVVCIALAAVLGGSYMREKLKAQVRGHMNKLGKMCA
ncbi:MAG: hypothetical protein V1839_02505 [archaeon]